MNTKNNWLTMALILLALLVMVLPIFAQEPLDDERLGEALPMPTRVTSESLSPITNQASDYSIAITPSDISTGTLRSPVIRSPAKNPPKLEAPQPIYPSLTPQGEEREAGQSGNPTTEWTLHKSSDDLHPDGHEQQAIWLMNRARSNPTEEGVWLATTDESDVAGGRDDFGVDLEVLQEEFASYDAKPPAAFDVRLYNAAKAHSDDLIERDAQDHDGQFDRVDEAGFSCAGWRGHVFSYARSGLNAHGAFNIDWGGDPPDGMQAGRGHRMAVMSIDGDYTNVGIAMVSETDPSTHVGPLVTTGNYCHAGSGTDHYNRFIVGTVWEDLDGDSMYDPREGVADVTVMPDSGTYYAVTGHSGGYAIPITAEGTYQVTFSGVVNTVKSVTVGSQSVLLDHLVGSPQVGSWLETTSLPQAMGTPFVGAGKQLVIYNGRVYLFGGRNDDNSRPTNVYYSTINADGSLGAWVETTSLPGEYYDQAVVRVGDYVYFITGAASATAVYYAPINPDGSLGTWISTASLTPSRQNFATVAYGEYIYASGGNSGGTQDFVKFTSVNPAGSLNPWTETTPLPEAIEGHSMVAVNGYLYVLAPNSAVYVAPINSDGTVGDWTTTTSMPQAMSGYTIFEYNGYLYLLGGSSQTVYYAPILTDNSLGEWQTTTSLPEQRRHLHAGGYNGFVYAVGGHDGNSYQDTVYYAQLENQCEGETVVAPFTGGFSAVTTSGVYTGLTTITVSGTGQASGSDYSDAFYIFAHADGSPIIPPVHYTSQYNFVLRINGQRAEDLIPGQQVPAYREDHTYTFAIDAPGGNLTFGVGDTATGDNTGNYTVTIHCQLQNPAPWPTFHYSASRTGQVPHLGSVVTPTQIFDVNIGMAVGVPVIGEGGVVYAGAYDSKFYAFNSDLTLRWMEDLPAPTIGTPSIGMDGTLYIGAGETVNAFQPDGTLIWTTPITGSGASTTAIGPDGTIYAGDLYLFALNPDGTLKWANYHHQGGGNMALSPDGSQLYAGSYHLHAFDAQTGSLLWDSANQVPGEVLHYRPPAIGPDGTIYLASHNSKLYALQPDDGSLKWTFQLPRETYVTPAISPDGRVIYVTSVGRKLHAVQASDGQELWQFTMGFDANASPIVDSVGRIYVNAGDQYFYAFNPNGTLLWKQEAPGYSGVSQCYHPVMGENGTLYYAGGGAPWSYDWGGLVALQQESPPTAPVTLALSPSTVTTGVGQTFEVTIEVQAGTQPVDSASATLNFDPTVMQVASITPGSDLPNVLANNFDNDSGQLEFAADSQSAASGSFTLATVTFNAIGVTDGTDIDFAPASDATYNGTSVLKSTSGSRITILNTILVGSVTLQGRPSAPHERWSVPLRVSLTVPGESVPAYQFEPTTDQSGTFTITSGITPGTYDVRVKNSHTLQNKQTVTLTGGNNNIDFGTLREGDVNDDNYVTLVDFSLLVKTFAKCEGDTNYDERADFNEDDCVTILDFSLLASNFAQGGQRKPATSSPPSNAQVTMAVEPASTTVERGEVFQVTVLLSASEQQVDGAQVMLNFDPDVLEVEELITGGKLELELANQFDNQQGTISFAA